jgi:hypothetical protein
MPSIALVLAVAAAGDDHARGLQLLAEGKFAEAVAAFRAAIAEDQTNAELHYNLALALWRAGQAHDAEIAAEKAATLSDGELAPLRDGILGNTKMDEAQAKLSGDAPDLQAALAAAQKARDHFLHGASGEPLPELVRNLERALQLIADIEKKIEEQEKDEEQQKDDQQKDVDSKDEQDDSKSEDEKKDDAQDQQQKDQQQKDQQKKDDESERQDKKQGDGEKQPDQKQDESQKGEDQREQGQPPSEGDNKDKPEPQAQAGEGREPQEKDERKPDPQAEPKDPQGSDPQAKDDPPPPGKEQKPEPQQSGEEPEDGEAKPSSSPPPLGQPQPGRELSPEETKRLLERLQAILDQKAEMEKAQKAQRPRVKKDW